MKLAGDAVLHAVADLEHNILVTSGAGCGKTYQMVERYLQLVRSGVEVSRIVAVTFTEKAAQELKGRVRERCRELATEGGEEGRRWQRAARRLEMAPIGTIHSFCARLLRENAVAAHVDPLFSQLDETEQAFLLRDTLRDLLLERLHANAETAHALVGGLGMSDALSLLERLVAQRELYRSLLEERPQADELLARWRAFAEAAASEVLHEVLSSEGWQDVVAELSSLRPPAAVDAAARRQGEFLVQAEAAADTNRPLDERLSAVCVALSQGHRGVGSKKTWQGREDDLQRVKSALAHLADLKDEHLKRMRALMEIEPAETAQLAAAICQEAGAATDAYQRAKDERSALDFADLQIRARDLLRDNAEVLARCRERYQQVMVDEFQDTNALQKEILWYVAGGEVSAGQAPPPGRLFVVGDAKQSIYGFRGADVSVFNRTQDEFEQDPSCRVVRLEESRRSHPSLVAFHNSLFSDPAVMGTDNPDPYEAEYEPLEAHRPPLEGQPDAELLLAPTPDELDSGLSVRELRELEADALAARIEQIVEGEELTVCPRDEHGERHPRPASFGDFAMLFAAMTDVGLYESALRQRGIPFYTVAGRGFYARQEIRDCLSLLSVLENAADDLSLAAALRSPFFALSDDTLFWLRQAQNHLMASLGQAAEGSFAHQAQLAPGEAEKIERAAEVIGRLRACKNQLSLSELVERMLIDTGLTGTLLTQFAGRQAVANLRKLTDLARAFEARGEFSLRAFIAYLRDLVLEDHHEGLAAAHEEAGDVVQLLTVHKAKGMQWPIVVVPDLARKPRGSQEKVALSDELGPIPKVEMPNGERQFGATAELVRSLNRRREEAEKRRLLYVALTRAEDHLILSSSVELDKDGRFKGDTWLGWLAEALDLQPHTAEGTELTDAGGTWTCVVKRPEREPSPAVGAGSRWAERADLADLTEALAAQRPTLHGEEGRLRSAVQPLPPVEPETARYSVTALSNYLECPRRYQLRHVDDMPERIEPEARLEELSPTDRGELAHTVMELVGRDGISELEQAMALATFPGAMEMRVSEAQREDLSEGLGWFLESDEYSEWIADAVRLRSEVPFAVMLEGAILEGKIDALAEDAAGRTYLLDYKTRGRAEGARLQEYRFQLGLYCAAVHATSGRLPHLAALVYLDAHSVAPFDPEELMQESLERARAAIAGIAEGRFDRADQANCETCALAYACELS